MANNPARWADPSGYLYTETKTQTKVSAAAAVGLAILGRAIEGSIWTLVCYFQPDCRAVAQTIWRATPRVWPWVGQAAVDVITGTVTEWGPTIGPHKPDQPKPTDEPEPGDGTPTSREKTPTGTGTQPPRGNDCLPGEVAHHLIPLQILNSDQFRRNLSQSSQWRLRYIMNIKCIPLWKHLEIHNIGMPVGVRYNPWWTDWIKRLESYPKEIEFMFRREKAINDYGLRIYRYRNSTWN